MVMGLHNFHNTYLAMEEKKKKKKKRSYGHHFVFFQGEIKVTMNQALHFNCSFFSLVLGLYN